MTETSSRQRADEHNEEAVAAVGAGPSQATPDLVARMVGNLDTTDQKKEAAVAAVGAVPSEATPDVVGTMVGNLDTTDQKKEAAVAAVGAVPSEATPDVVGTMVGNLGSADQVRAAAAAMNALPAQRQQDLANSILGTPSSKVQGSLWLIVVITISAAIFIFGVLSFVLVLSGRGAEGPLALATTALGGIVGLIATTPGRRS
jgi:hypothetical protein